MYTLKQQEVRRLSYWSLVSERKERMMRPKKKLSTIEISEEREDVNTSAEIIIHASVYGVRYLYT